MRRFIAGLCALFASVGVVVGIAAAPAHADIDLGPVCIVGSAENPTAISVGESGLPALDDAPCEPDGQRVSIPPL